VEPDTVSTPKINKSTFSFGSGSLMKRVANNEKKITVLSNIIQTQRSNIGEKITPKMSSLQESLMVTNEVLVDIARQLEEDFDSRVVEKKSLLQKNREEKLEIRRQQVLEEKAENKQTEKIVKTSARKTIKPLGNIFGKVFELIKILGTGILVNAVVGNFGKIIGFFRGDTFNNIKERLSTAYKQITKFMGALVKLGTGFINLELAVTVAKVVAVGAGIMAILSNPILFAGIGIIAAAAMQGLGRGEKQTLDELEKMGGFTQENRNKLIEKLKEQKSNLTPLEKLQGVGSEINERIKFLETGEYGYGKNPKVFDFSSIEKMKSLSNFDKSLLSIDDDSLGGVEFQDMPPIDMRNEKKGEQVLEPGGGSGTNVGAVSSFNGMNNYMKETPSLFGFSDLVYT
tara:strand:+ start:183 stop:1382 length:1200 start_codon:yes stop_codon:yes gene_type:complete